MPSVIDKQTKIDTKVSKIARAKKEENGLFGYIDQNYDVFIDFEYDYVFDFVNGFGVVKSDGKYGAFDASGNIVKKLIQVEPKTMDIAIDEYNIFRDPKWHINMARTMVGTSNYYAVRYEMGKFVIFPEEFYERNIPGNDKPNFSVYRKQHGFFSVGAFMGVDGVKIKDIKRKKTKPKKKRDLKNFNEIEFKADIEELLEKFDDLLKKNDIPLDIYDKNQFSIKKSSNKIEIEIDNGESDEKQILIKRVIEAKGNEIIAKHKHFFIPESLQNEGFSREFFKATFKQYDEDHIGVTKIEVFANLDVGGYTWARYGFYASNKSVVDNIIQKAESQIRDEGEIKHEWTENGIKRESILDETGLLEAKNYLEGFYKTRNKDERFFMNILAEQPWGRALLIGTLWDGTIDLTDSEERSYFERYIFDNRKKINKGK